MEKGLEGTPCKGLWKGRCLFNPGRGEAGVLLQVGGGRQTRSVRVTPEADPGPTGSRSWEGRLGLRIAKDLSSSSAVLADEGVANESRPIEPTDGSHPGWRERTRGPQVLSKSEFLGFHASGSSGRQRRA